MGAAGWAGIKEMKSLCFESITLFFFFTKKLEEKLETDQSISKIWVENCSMRGCGRRVLAAGNGRGWTDFTDINVKALCLGEELRWKCHHFWELQLCSRLRHLCWLPSDMSSSATLLRANCLKGFPPPRIISKRWVSFTSETLPCQLCSGCSVSWLRARRYKLFPFCRLFTVYVFGPKALEHTEPNGIKTKQFAS